MTRIVLALLLACGTASAADVQAFTVDLKAIAEAAPAAREDAIQALLDKTPEVIIALRSDATSRSRIVREYRALRSDSQTGASNGASGSTSLVLNPFLADIFGISFEAGSILKTVSGSTINLQIKPAGIICATKAEDGANAAPDSNCLDFWKRVGITVAFDKGRSNAPSQLVALEDDFSQVKLHYDLLQPLLKGAERDLTARLGNLSEGAVDVRAAFLRNDALKQWTDKSKTALLDAMGTTPVERQMALEMIWSARLDELQSLINMDSSVKSLVPQFERFADEFIKANARSIVLERLERTNFAAEVSFDRPDVAKADSVNGIIVKGQRPPDLITARLIYSRNYRPLILTANAEASWFDETLPGMSGNFRNWQVSGSATFLLKEIPNFGKTTLSFSGLIGDLHQQPLGFDYTVPSPSDPTQMVKVDLSGSIRAFNARLEFPTANKSVTIPISFTYTNRTDLQKEADVKGSIGLTLRFDSFFPEKAAPR